MLVLFICVHISTFVAGLLGYFFSSRLGLSMGLGAMSLCIHMCLGTLFFCDLFLFFSLFFALKPVLVLPVLFFTILILGKGKSRIIFSNYWNLYRNQSLNHLIACLCASSLALPEMVWGDTHLYHYPITRWLAEFGLVGGLGNLHNAYSNTHGWFVLTAVWDHGIFSQKMGAFGGTFVVSLTLLGLCLAVDGLKKQQDIISNSVFLIAATLMLGVLSAYHNILNSLSPDIMPQLIILLCSWLWLCKRFGQKIRMDMALLLGAFILSIRLSTAPLMLVLGGFYLLKKPESPIKRLCILILILIPAGLSTFLASGCFFFPIPWFCLNSPVSITDGTALHMKAHIQEYSRWCGMSEPKGASFLDWVPGWLVCEYGSLFLISTVVFCWLLLLLVPSGTKSKISGLNEVIILHLAGVWFVLYNAPATRYGVSWFCLGIGLAFAVIAGKALSHILYYLRPTALYCLLVMSYYWIKHPMRFEINNHLFWEKHLSEVIFFHSTRAFLDEDKFKAFVLSDWACTLNKGHKNACSDALMLLSELNTNDILRLQSEEANLIRQNTSIPKPKHLPWIIPLEASHKFANQYRLMDWEGVTVSVPDTKQDEAHCSSALPPCIHRERLSEIRLLRPELGVSGGFRRADFTP